MDTSYDKNTIDRYHRIGRIYKDKNTGKECKSIIIKLRSWSARQKFYQSRPRFYVNGVRKKPGNDSFSVSLDLTKRNYELLKIAKEQIKINNKIDYAFVDSNCSLAVKFKEGRITHFNSLDQLDMIINK